MPPRGGALRGGRAGGATKFFHAFPRISKPFQGKSKFFQVFPRKMQIYSLAVSNEIKGLAAAAADFGVFEASLVEQVALRRNRRCTYLCHSRESGNPAGKGASIAKSGFPLSRE
jgi:hypothetical protein